MIVITFGSKYYRFYILFSVRISGRMPCHFLVSGHCDNCSHKQDFDVYDNDVADYEPTFESQASPRAESDQYRPAFDFQANPRSSDPDQPSPDFQSNPTSGMEGGKRLRRIKNRKTTSKRRTAKRKLSTKRVLKRKVSAKRNLKRKTRTRH